MVNLTGSCNSRFQPHDDTNQFEIESDFEELSLTGPREARHFEGNLADKPEVFPRNDS